jgi:hypothetical protein
MATLLALCVRTQERRASPESTARIREILGKPGAIFNEPETTTGSVAVLTRLSPMAYTKYSGLKRINSRLG